MPSYARGGRLWGFSWDVNECGPVGPVWTGGWTGSKSPQSPLYVWARTDGTGGTGRNGRGQGRKSMNEKAWANNDAGNIMVYHGVQAARTSRRASLRPSRPCAEMTRSAPPKWGDAC